MTAKIFAAGAEIGHPSVSVTENHVTVFLSPRSFVIVDDAADAERLEKVFGEVREILQARQAATPALHAASAA